MGEKLAVLDASVLRKVRTLVGDLDLSLPDGWLDPFIEIARQQQLTELPFRAAALFLLTRGDKSWRDLIAASVPCSAVSVDPPVGPKFNREVA